MCNECKRLQAQLGEREMRIAKLQGELATDRAFSGALLWLAIAMLTLGIWTWKGSELASLISRPRAAATQTEVAPPAPQQPLQAPGGQRKK